MKEDCPLRLTKWHLLHKSAPSKREAQQAITANHRAAIASNKEGVLVKLQAKQRGGVVHTVAARAFRHLVDTCVIYTAATAVAATEIAPFAKEERTKLARVFAVIALYCCED
jgi:HJR/Mrr/RecB family endonuclease